MTASNHTSHYDLSQFAESDRPAWFWDYNGDMSKIDAAIYAASQTGGGLSTVEHDNTLVGDGTSGSPLSLATGTMITQSNELYGCVADLNNYKKPGAYNLRLTQGSTNLPTPTSTTFIGFMLVLLSGYEQTVTQLVYFRDQQNGGLFFIVTLRQ